MAQVRGTFPQLNDNIDKVIRAILKDTLKENPAIYPAYYNEMTSDRKFERRMTLTPFGDVPEKPEGEVYSLDIIRPAYSKDFTHVEFGMGFEVTETALEDDQYDQLNRSAEWLAFSARYVQELRAAQPLNNGFSTELSGNGQPLFSATQPLAGGGTARNKLSAAADLTFTSLSQAMVDSQLETKIESGQIVAPIKAFNLVIHPSNEFNAHRILQSAGLPGSMDNDTNPLKALRSIKVIVNPHLTDTDAWFLIPAQKSMHSLRTYVRRPITQIPAVVDPYTGNKLVKIRFRQSWGAETWQGLFASEGA